MLCHICLNSINSNFGRTLGLNNNTIKEILTKQLLDKNCCNKGVNYFGG